jgi:protein SCO1/2
LRRSSRRFLLAAALAVAFAWAASAAARVEGVILDRPLPVQAFTLDDHDGKPFTADSLAGHWSLILPGFTNCPDVCPFTLANLEQLVADLGLRVAPDRLPQVIFLAVDPDRDRPSLKEFVRQFHLDFIGITGTIDQIDRLLQGMDAIARRGKPDARGAYEVTHSAAVAVIDPQGRLCARINPPFDPAPTAQILVDLFRKHGNAPASEGGR